MDAWRGVVLLCSLMMGCGGPSGESGQGDEGPQETLPSEPPADGTPGGQDGEVPGDGERQPPPTTPPPETPPTETPPTEPPPTETPPTETPPVTDRPTLGTAHLVKDIFPPSDMPARLAPAPGNLVAFGGKLFFAANVEEGNSGLWSSDGTEAGTVEIKHFTTDPTQLVAWVDNLKPVGSRLFFTGTDAASGNELWVTNGTSGGTRLVKDITPGPEGGSFSYFTAVNNTLFFFRQVRDAADVPARYELWRSDGTDAGTRRIKDMGPDSYTNQEPIVLGNKLIFSLTDAAHGREPWVSDGTEVGTHQLRDIRPGTDGAFPKDFQRVGSFVFFTASMASGANELWRTDGTEAGTQSVLQLSTTPSPYPRLIGAAGNRIYLGMLGFEDQLMRLYTLTVDGAGGAQRTLVKELPNPYASQGEAAPYVTQSVAVTQGKVYFGYAIGSPGPAPRDVQLWVSDGTAAGTRQLMRPLSTSDEFESSIVTVDERVIFCGSGPNAGLEPWVTNGTVAGTRQLQDVRPGTDGSVPRSFTRVGNKVFFVAHDGTHGNDLWVFP